MTNINALNIGNVALPGDGYAPLAAFTLPASLRAGLAVALFPGNGLIDDFGPNGLTPAFVGAPTRISGGYTCDASNYIDAGLVDSSAVSMAIIARRKTTDATGYGGNVNIVTSSDVRGAGFYSGASGTTMAFQAGRTGLAPGASVVSVAATLSSWGLYIARASTSQNTTIKNLTSGAVVENATATGTGRVTNSANARVGAVPEPDYPAAADVALYLQWDRYLTDTDFNNFEAWATAYAASLGITV